jgi:catechol 2,3-dioxygenase-like lactoylglutathione lyase family enzyme
MKRKTKPKAKSSIKLNHMSLIVKDVQKSRDWYVGNLGLNLEFEVLKNGFVALEDSEGFGFLLAEGKPGKNPERNLAIYFQVENVDRLHKRLSSAGLKFDHEPKHTEWGYGPELLDPDGYVLRFFDRRSVTK